MAIRVTCPECSKNYQFSDDKAGRRFRCKECETLVDVPQLQEQEEFLDELEIISDSPRGGSPAAPARKPKSKGKSKSSIRFGVAGYLETFQKFGTFSGRANRTEYWNFYFFNFLILCVFSIAANLLGSGVKNDINPAQMVVLGLFAIYVLASFVPNIVVTVRRLHDTDRSGWWFLIIFLPYLGGLILLVLMLLPGTPGRNTYGPRPS